MNIAPLTPLCPEDEIIGSRIILKKIDNTMTQKVLGVIEADRERLEKWLAWAADLRTEEDEKNYFDQCLESWSSHKEFIFGIFLKEDLSYIGNICLHNIIWADHKAEIGYWVSSQGEGKGFVRESVSLIEKLGFSLGFHRLEIRCSPQNIKSLSIPLKLNYRLEGVHYQDVLINGRFEDTICFAKLKGDQYRTDSLLSSSLNR